MVAMTAVVFAQVVARYIVQAPLSWSEELARFLLMWLSMLSAAYAFKTKSHFALRILVDRFPRKLRHTVSILVHAAGIFFFAVLLYFSIVFVAGVGGHIAPALQIPMEIPYASIVVGSAVVLIELLRSAWHELIGRGIKATD
ncbi:MAG: TRAP transporter small permease [Hyphomicrobiales bacterium]|nr:TRAP transporter small permease [Hyphomicrobiales bacterium]